MIPKTCIKLCNNKVIPLKEKKCCFVVRNNSRQDITIVRVDGCAITDGIRCDYLLSIDRLEVYIELKGHDIEHAKKQLERTIRLLSKDQRRIPKRAFIICVRSPIQSPQIQRWQIEFKRKYQSMLEVKSIRYEFYL